MMMWASVVGNAGLMAAPTVYGLWLVQCNSSVENFDPSVETSHSVESKEVGHSSVEGARAEAGVQSCGIVGVVGTVDQGTADADGCILPAHDFLFLSSYIERSRHDRRRRVVSSSSASDVVSFL